MLPFEKIVQMLLKEPTVPPPLPPFRLCQMEYKASAMLIYTTTSAEKLNLLAAAPEIPALSDAGLLASIVVIVVEAVLATIRVTKILCG